MKFYHSTTKKNLECIVKSQNVFPSEFDLSSYLMQHLESGWFAKEDFQQSDSRMPDTYIEGDDEKKLFWLGNGVYCFTEIDLQEAIDYNDNHDAILVIKINPEVCNEFNVFNMDSKKNRAILQEFIDVGLKQLEDVQHTDTLKKYAANFRRQLKYCLHDNFRGTPYAAGILIDLYTGVFSNFKIVKCTFYFGGGKKNPMPWFSQYVAIKDLSVISQLEKCTEEKQYI